MTDKEIALELTKIYLNHQNAQIAAKGHMHTDLDLKGVMTVYESFYNLAVNVDSGK